MNSICFFSSYFTEKQIPFYVRFYLANIRNYFSEVVLLINEKELSADDMDFLNDQKIGLRLYANEGYDFGMWYKALEEFHINAYDRVGLINDSCVLFKDPAGLFDWINSKTLDYCGVTDSNAISYHIQSYFLIINKKAIPFVIDYFKDNKIYSEIKDVISKYEVGLSSYMLKQKLRIGAVYSFKEYAGEYSPMLLFAEDLISRGIPMLKRKQICFSFRKEEMFTLMRMNYIAEPDHYIKLIREENPQNNLIDFQKVVDLDSKILNRRIMAFNLKTRMFQLMRKFKFS